MAEATVEILVEPFRENDPGPHVQAVWSVFTNAGMSIDVGPFATTVRGPLVELVNVVPAAVEAGFEAGASSVQLRFESA